MTSQPRLIRRSRNEEIVMHLRMSFRRSTSALEHRRRPRDYPPVLFLLPTRLGLARLVPLSDLLKPFPQVRCVVPDEPRGVRVGLECGYDARVVEVVQDPGRELRVVELCRHLGRPRGEVRRLPDRPRHGAPAARRLSGGERVGRFKVE